MAILRGTAGSAGRRRKIVGSASVLGVAAAVAGLGTFSTFTDSTTPVSTQLNAGVLSLTLQDNGAVATAPFQGGTFLAGDSQSHPLDLVNDGNTALASVTMRSTATSSSVLDTDPVNGLQLTVDTCSQAWSGSGSTWSCSGTSRNLYSGPMITTATLISSASLTPGGTDHLLLTATLPATASGDAFQNAASSLSFVFDGVQRAGAVR